MSLRRGTTLSPEEMHNTPYPFDHRMCWIIYQSDYSTLREATENKNRGDIE